MKIIKLFFLTSFAIGHHITEISVEEKLGFLNN